VIGVREDGCKELLAVEDGYRESTDSRALREPFGLLRAGAGVAGGPTVETRSRSGGSSG